MKSFPVLAFYILFASQLFAQVQKQTKEDTHVWVAFISSFQLNEKWNLLADVHYRRTDFLNKPGFFVARVSPEYKFKSGLKLAAGYANLLSAPTNPGLNTWADEHRIFQQLIYPSSIGKISLLHRIRNEQRWRQIMDTKNDAWTGEYAFTNRVRYLLSLNIPINHSEKHPAFILADEILVHFGKSITYNTFDQNRIFVGYRQNISKKRAFDVGYMRIFQQKQSGFQYDLNHTIRLFFYGNFSGEHHKNHQHSL